MVMHMHMHLASGPLVERNFCQQQAHISATVWRQRYDRNVQAQTTV